MDIYEILNKLDETTLEQGPPSKAGGELGNKQCPEGYRW